MNTNAVPRLGVPGQFNKVILMCQCCLFAGLTLTAIVILGQKTEPKSLQPKLTMKDESD